MTLDELISEFRTIIELDSSGLPGLTDEEIILYLDNGQSKFISHRLEGHTVDGSKYPNTQKRIDDLNSLYKITNIGSYNVTGVTENNFYDFDLSSLTDYLHFNQATLVVNDVGRFKMDKIPMHETDKFEYSNINQPYIERPVYSILNNGMYPIVRTYFDLHDAKDQLWSMSLYVGYIKTPTNLKKVFSDSGGTYPVNDFSYSSYKEIIKLGVDEAIAVIAPQRSQISQQQLNKSE